MKILMTLVILVSASFASAQSKIVSIDAFDLSYTGGLLLKSDDGKGSDRDETTFALNLNYAQNLEQYVGLMWKVKAFVNRQDIDFGTNDYQETRWGGAGGFLYNFQSEQIKDSFYAGALVGIERATYEIGNASDKSGFNIFTDLEAGKRWDMGQYSAANISYSPSLAMTFKRYGGNIRDRYFKSGNEIKINFLKFDILF